MLRYQRIAVGLCLAVVVLATGCRGDRRDDAVGTTGGAPRVTDVTLGRAIGGDKAITDRTEVFRPNDSIYASVETSGSGQSATLRARWTFGDGQVVDQSERTIATGARDRTEFHIAKPDGWPVGRYRLELFLNGEQVETKNFEVRER